jgi:23S rRNA (guanine2445-N2)-methyltransferase / 23S rRNA (guanine2069-N7)-methyltransferase
MSFSLIATTTGGLEAVTARELSELGYQPRIIGLGRVLFEGDENAIVRANLWLRTAGRVLICMDRFPATDFGKLFDRTTSLPWERWIPREGAFPVKGRSVRSQLSSVPACQRCVKKAIAERLQKAFCGATLEENGPNYPVEVSLVRDEVLLTIDTSGAGLHQRGYRKLIGPAPLRETLAAGLILLSFWNSKRVLLDPFCGSGTIPIEAAWIGRNIAPGSLREFQAQKWPNFPGTLWEHYRQEAKALERPALEERIIGTDHSEESLSLARYHAKQAKVVHDIHWQRRDFHDLASRRRYGCIITNPPYARRMGEWDDVRSLYEDLPLVLRRLPDWSHFIFTAFPDFETIVGQPANRRRKLYNGTIECTYYQYHGPKPPDFGESNEPESSRSSRKEKVLEDSPKGRLPENDREEEREKKPATRTKDATSHGAKPPRQVFGGVGEKAREQAEIFENRLRKTQRHLRRWPKRRGITCFRLYDRDIPEIPLVVDRYESCLHIAEYERPHDRTPAEHADWLDLMRRTAAKVLEIAPEHVFFKHRRPQRGNDQYGRISREAKVFRVQEGGLTFEVNLSDYLDTGLFLDHRQTRAMVREEASGRRFLNLFAYTGSFTAYAADGEAATTTTVDSSTTYLDWAQRNMRLNGFDGKRHSFHRADALAFVEQLPEEPLFDLAVVDPPTFSNSKQMDEDWRIDRDHSRLLHALASRLSAGGVVYFSTNFRRFKIDQTLNTEYDLREISRQTVPEDFRNKRIHRCWRMVKK